MIKTLKISLSLLILYSLPGCIHGDLTVCISNPGQGGFECSKGGAKSVHLDYKDSENYVALPPDDARTVLEKCYKDSKE